MRSAIDPLGANTALTCDDLGVSAFLPMNARIGSKITNAARYSMMASLGDNCLADYRLVLFDVNLGVSFRARHQFVVPDGFFVDSEVEPAFGAFEH